MKKSILLAASLLALNLTPVFGQPNPNGTPPPAPNFQQRLKEIVNSANAPQNQPPALTKFNLDFPGGTPAELVKAIEKAMGKPLNAIIPDENADTKIPALKMSNVDVPHLFNAVVNMSYKYAPSAPSPSDSVVDSVVDLNLNRVTWSAVMVLKPRITMCQTTQFGISSSIKLRHNRLHRRRKKSASFIHCRLIWIAASRWMTSPRPFKPAGKWRA